MKATPPAVPAVSLNLSLGPLAASVAFQNTADFVAHGIPLLNQARETAFTAMQYQLFQQSQMQQSQFQQAQIHQQQQQLSWGMNMGVIPGLQLCGSQAQPSDQQQVAVATKAGPSDNLQPDDGVARTATATPTHSASGSAAVPHPIHPPR